MQRYYRDKTKEEYKFTMEQVSVKHDIFNFSMIEVLKEQKKNMTVKSFLTVVLRSVFILIYWNISEVFLRVLLDVKFLLFYFLSTCLDLIKVPYEEGG